MGTNLPIGYTGAYQDPVTSSYPLGNGYRMYLPELMRFNSPDSWSPFGKGGIHPYAYCDGEPVNHADPSGHFGRLGILGGALLPLDFVPGVGEAADVLAVVNGLIDTVETADAGLAVRVARAAEATRYVVDLPAGGSAAVRKRIDSAA